jgi:hypothetical protein
MKNIVFIGQFKVEEDFLLKMEFRNIMFSYRYMFLAKADFYETVSVQVENTFQELTI